jgi:hypothetical protein
MATTNNTSSKSNKPASYTNKGNAYTPKGYMPPTMLKRFGLKENVPNIEGRDEKVDTRFSPSQARRIKKMTELVVTYRMITKQCVTETKLPSSLRSVVKYFSYPMSGFSNSNTGGNTGGGNYNKAASSAEENVSTATDKEATT